MPEALLFEKIGSKTISKNEIAVEISKQPDLLPLLFKGMEHHRANIKYGCAKVLLLLSETNPELLYPHIDHFIGLLESEQTIIKWNAILIIANLAVVDSQNKIEQIFDRYFAPIRGPVMITAGNVIAGGGRIAAAKPELAERIAGEVLKVTLARYQSEECRNIAIGHAINAFDLFFNVLSDKERIIQFVEENLDNPRKGTGKKAAAFLKKYKLLFFAEQA